MKAIMTVIGNDQIGIIAKISGIAAERGINILDISQTILQDYFTMIMLVDLEKMDVSFEEMISLLREKEEEIGVSIRLQREDLFKGMHKIN